MTWDKQYTVSGTMYRDKKTWVKKSLNFRLEAVDSKGKPKELGKGEINLATYCVENDNEEKKEVICPIKIGSSFSGANSNLKITIASRCMKNVKPG